MREWGEPIKNWTVVTNDAAFYGVPQSRFRAWGMGCKNQFQFPFKHTSFRLQGKFREAESIRGKRHIDTEELAEMMGRLWEKELVPPISVQEALNVYFSKADYIHDEFNGKTMRIWNTKGVAWTRFGDRWLDGAFDYNERKWTGQCRQDAGKIQAEFNTNGVREWRNLQSQRSSSVTRVAGTVTKSRPPFWVEDTGLQQKDICYNRKRINRGSNADLNAGELKALTTFPVSFKVDETLAKPCVGDSVPPLMAMIVLSAVRSAADEPSVPSLAQAAGIPTEDTPLLLYYYTVAHRLKPNMQKI